MKTFSEVVYEGKAGGLWDNIHAKRKRIKAGSKERMRKPGSEGAPTAQDFKDATEGKEHSWKSEGHYTEDGTEWTGPQHAYNGQVMTGEKHSDDSQKLYHYKELSKAAQDKVEKKHEVKEATYQGKKVPLNKPMAGDVKKSKVYVDPDGDGVAKKVNFGDKNMTIKKNIPARRKSFRARHKCDQKKPIDSAGYWSCKAW